MRRDYFMSYFADPFSLSEPIVAIKEQDAPAPHIVAFSELANMEGHFYTFQGALFVEALRTRQLELLPIVDVRHALQLASGRSRRNFERSEWAFREWLRLTNLHDWERESYLSLLNGEAIQPQKGSLQQLLLRTSVAMEDLWSGLSKELERLGELERFMQFEIPIQKLMYKRQWLGLAVDTVKSEELLQSAKANKYRAMLKVGESLQLNPTGLDYRTVLPFLKQTDAANLVDFSDSRALASYFKMAAIHSEVARNFRDMLQENTNIKSLLSIAASHGRVFPIFDTLATVTARIQTSNPNVQQLKRSYRGALRSDKGMHSGYFDYAQFEPGILAQHVGPGKFRDLYNSGDVYKALSEAVFKDAAKRGVAKQVFIAFCYGMDLASMGRLLGTWGKTNGWFYAQAVERFFEQFPELTEYKKACEARLQREGFISSVFGNRRVRLNRGHITRRERGWAMNQTIQGTGSLIFKDALLALARQFGDESILMPVHDAVWLQIPISSMTSSEFGASVERVMTSTFLKWCPDVNIKVTAARFEDS